MRRTLLLLVALLACATASAPAQRAPVAPLYFTVGIHVEPFGLQNGRIATSGFSYMNEQVFRLHAAYLRSLASAVERHGGRATIQVQSPFTDACVRFGDNVIGELRARGHEIALHFHEDAHLGRNSSALPAGQWAQVMAAQIEKIRALGVERVRMWSGGNLYPHLLDAARAAGLDVNSDWKNPQTQEQDARLLTTVPWIPAGSPNGTDLSAFTMHDPNGAIVFLPTGIIDPEAKHRDEIAASPSPARAMQDYWTGGLSASLSSAASHPGEVHVFHFTTHPGDLEKPRYGGAATLDEWLTREIDPLVAAGRVRWATFSQMADAYRASSRASGRN